MTIKMKKVLLIEDNPGDARLIREMIPQFEALQFNLECVERLSAGLEYFAREEVDVVLLDLNLPDSNGLDTFNKVNTLVPDVPIIVLTGLDDEASAVKAVQNGAQDYLVKGDVNSSLLMRSIRYAIERQRLLVDLKQKSEELQSAKNSFYSIVQMSEDGMVVIDQQGVVRFANQSAVSQFKLESERLIGSQFGRPIVSGNSTEIDILCANGTKGLAEMRTVNTSWHGETAHLAMLRDITDRKRNEELLVRQEKMAAMGQLASIVGHEIRNPLGTIKNSVEFLGIKICQNPDPDKKIKEHLRILHEEVHNINKLIDDILGFARTRELKVTTVSTNDLVETAVKSTSIPDNIRIVCEFGSNLPRIAVDSEQIHRVFLNILLNACEAMSTGGTLTIRTREHISEDEKKRNIAISFQDTGMGIPEDKLTRIFEPLFTTKSKGTGLGLAACQKISTAHHGSIEVESKISEGTIFTIIIPVNSKFKKED